MKGKFVSYIIMACLLTFTAVAETSEIPSMTETTGESIENAYSFSLEQAINYALENHPSMTLAISNVTKNEYSEREAFDLYAKNRYKNQYAFEAFLIKKGVVYQQTVMGLNIAKASLNQAKANIKFGVESAYYKYLNSNAKLEIAQSAYDSATTKLNQIEEQLAQGMSSSLELLVAQTTTKKSKSDLDKAKRDIDTALVELKAAIGIPLTSDVTLTTTSIEMPKLPEIILQDAVNQSKTNNFNVISANEQLLVAKVTFEATKGWYAKNTYKYSQANYGYLYAQDAYTNAITNAEITVHKAYDNVLSVWDSINIIKSNIELSEKTYEINKQKYDLGMITKIELDDSWYSLQSMKMQAADLNYSYYAAVRQYELSYK